MPEIHEVNELIRVLKNTQQQSYELSQNLKDLLDLLPPDKTYPFYPDLLAFHKGYADLIYHAKVRTASVLQIVTDQLPPTPEPTKKPGTPVESEEGND